ncbi:ras-related protein Rab-37-like [Styela clava]|uniref:ras-related protein Rab-37-like n=1 Tax=Styela clava TaxID=7725 RepID=UPI0019397365|nr:ras-related protein Rab-37-like [Styela clava]
MTSKSSTSNGRTRMSSSVSITDFDASFKVMLVGDSGVGKTCVLVRYKDDTFLSGSFISTVGIDFRNKMVLIDDRKIKLQIWDTAGQERFRSVTHAYYRDANALLLVYDITNRQSFNNVRSWIADIKQHAKENVIVMLIGNKADCSSTRMVTLAEGEKLAKEFELVFVETSARSGMNVELAFKAVARELHRKSLTAADCIGYDRGANCKTRDSFNISKYVEEEKEKMSCC